MSSQKAALPPVPPERWIGYLGLVLAGFIAVLDTVVTNTAMPNIQAALGATVDEISWVSTAYLIGEVIAIPLSGWLVRLLSMRTLALTVASVFVLSSLACAVSGDLNAMIAARFVQGFSGGFFIPIVMLGAIELLGAERYTTGAAIFGMSTTFAVAAGPTVGGFLTDQLNWHWIFLMNVLPGLASLLAIRRGVPARPRQLELLAKIDWAGIVTLVIGLTALQTALEEGARKDWFQSDFIVTASAIALVALAAFVTIELRGSSPVVDLRLLRRPTFFFACLLNAAAGFAAYAMLYLMPLFLGMIQGLTASDIGQLFMLGGIAQIFLMPIAPVLLKRLKHRKMLIASTLLFAASSYFTSSLDHDVPRSLLAMPIILRSLAQPLVLVSLSVVAFDGLKPLELGSAAGLFNMARQLGASVGISLISTTLINRHDLHFARLVDSLSRFRLATRDQLADLTNMLTMRNGDPVRAYSGALSLVDRLAHREAYVMAFNDCFMLVVVIVLATGGLLFVMRMPSGASLSGGADH